MTSIVCRPAAGAEDLSSCLAIRDTVFVQGQNVPAELERDGLDDSCLHFLALIDGKPVGTARVNVLDGVFKFQRVAVLDEVRGRGIGAALMAHMMETLALRSDAEGRAFFLSSQVHAIPFYERLGFQVCSGVYLDAGIDHVDMRAEIVR